MSKPPRPVCPYCNRKAVLLMNSSELYYNHINYGPVWICRPCDAWVGCHKNQSGSRIVPKGRLANAELRKAKIEAHAAFVTISSFDHEHMDGSHESSESKVRTAISECSIWKRAGRSSRSAAELQCLFDHRHQDRSRV